MRSALSERLREGNIIIIDDFKIGNSKTKDFIKVMADLGFENGKKQTKVLIVDSLENENLILSSRNVKRTKVTNGYGVNIYDLIYHEKLLISKSALEELTGLLDPKRSKDVDESEVVKEKKPKATPKKKAQKETDKVTEEKPETKKEAKPKKEKAEKVEAKETKKKVKKEEPITEKIKPEDTSTETEVNIENEEAAKDD